MYSVHNGFTVVKHGISYYVSIYYLKALEEIPAGNKARDNQNSYQSDCDIQKFLNNLQG